MTRRRDPAGSLTRRAFLRGAAGAAVLAGCGGGRAPTGPPIAHRSFFAHAVASGDPLADRVMLWTRLSPPGGVPADGVEVGWRVARDPALRDVVVRGAAEAAASRDWTVKVDAIGLEPGRTWYYAFEALGETSPVGRTRTLPLGPAGRLRLAACSCANHPQGYFNAYAAIARRADLDAVLHLGDYIYEYGNQGQGAGRPGRLPEPPHECVSITDYRTRYAQYRRDPDLQALHRQHPVIAVWDDHESANDAWREGAANHDPASEGAWRDRRAAAVQAWREWMPARVPADGDFEVEPRIWRAFRFGDLAELAMIDTRLAARDAQAPRTDPAAIAAPDRALLGAAQEAWLLATLDAAQAAGTAWRLIGQQVVFAPWARPPRLPNTDAWDGYPAARARILDHLAARGIRDVVILTGDVHSSWALEVPREPFAPAAYDPATGAGALAVEFVAPAISSAPLASFPGAAERFGRSLEELPHLRFMDLEQRGYVLLDVDRARTQAEWWFVDTVERPSAVERFAAGFATRRGASHLEAVDEPSEPRQDAPAPAP